MGEKMTLLPCPFCGNSDRVHVREQIGDTWFHVECAHCDSRTTNSRELAKAVSSWNTRHLATPVQTVDAWMTDDDRVISARQKASAIKDGGASASSVASYAIPLIRAIRNAQTVDVESVHEVIAQLKFSYGLGLSNVSCQKLADKLAQAIGDKT